MLKGKLAGGIILKKVFGAIGFGRAVKMGRVVGGG
jgi:hypothetical protein